MNKYWNLKSIIVQAWTCWASRLKFGVEGGGNSGINKAISTVLEQVMCLESPLRKNAKYREPGEQKDRTDGQENLI